MKDEFDKLIDNAKNIELGVSEKENIKTALFSHIESTRPKGEIFWRRREAKSDKLSWIFRFVPLKPNLTKQLASALVIVMFFSAGITFASEKALPGDFLYLVKTGINERVIELTKLNPQAKVKWNTRVAERRLEEAEKLAGKNKLGQEARAKIESNFEKHAERIRERINRFETEKNLETASDISSNFEITLRVHEKILDRISEEKTEAANEVRPILEKVRKKIKESEEYQIRIKTESKPHDTQDNESKNNNSSDHTQSKRNKHKNPENNAANAGQKRRN